MQRTLSATAILLALSLPAYAQSTTPTQPAPGQTESRGSGQTQGGQNASTLPIDQSRLSEADIRKIQLELNKAGFDAQDVDGKWGPNSRSALRNYQQQQSLPGDGELNQQTLYALGVAVASQQGGGSSATGAATGEQGSSAPPARSQGATTGGRGTPG